MSSKKWIGVYPAVLLPFEDDYSVDEDGFRSLLRWIVGHEGVSGVVVNGHAGEVNLLLPEERAEVVRIAVAELQNEVPVISGVSAEGTIEAGLHAKAVESSGGAGILLMPPHSWLRFAMQPASVGEFFRGVADAVDIPLIAHQYPRGTKAAYNTAQLLELASMPSVEAVTIGTRDMAQYEVDVRALKASAPDVSILSCHDEYLLPTLVQGVDGALVGLACFVPDLVVALVRAVERNDLEEANSVYARIHALKHAVYGMGEPSAASHARMKEAMYQRGLIANPLARPPAIPLTSAERADIRGALVECDLIPSLSA